MRKTNADKQVTCVIKAIGKLNKHQVFTLSQVITPKPCHLLLLVYIDAPELMDVLCYTLYYINLSDELQAINKDLDQIKLFGTIRNSEH